MITEILSATEKQCIAQSVLSQLPDWFGVPESTKRYIDGVCDKPFWADLEAGRVLGFISLKETSPDTAEIYVMGVMPGFHRRGIGSKLYDAFETYAKSTGYSFLQVKTVQKGHWESYDKTNEFYLAKGFRELECFPDFWDTKNPCQIYIKAI